MAFSPELKQVVEQKFSSRLRKKQNNNRVVAHKADNVPDRFELFLLDEGQEKVEEKAETRKYFITSLSSIPSH